MCGMLAGAFLAIAVGLLAIQWLLSYVEVPLVGGSHDLLPYLAFGFAVVALVFGVFALVAWLRARRA